MSSDAGAHPWTIPMLRDFLGRALSGPLPRAEGQGRMAPRPRTGWKPDVLPADCRDAAALLLLYPKDNDAHILLTVRTEHLPTHQGQVSLPGGGVSAGEGIVDAALRELHEEVGIQSDDVEIIGNLSPLHIPVSAFILHPVVALSERRPEIHPRETEVAQALEVPLQTLQDATAIQVETRVYDRQTYRVPYFFVHDHKVWGATAMVLSEFLCIIGSPPFPEIKG